MSTNTDIPATRKSPTKKVIKSTRKTGSITEGAKAQPVIDQPSAADTADKLEKAKASQAAHAKAYDPTLASAHDLSVGQKTVERAVQSLRQYAAMIGAPLDSHPLFIIVKGGVTLPPLRKVWDKCAAILDITPLSTGEYGESDSRKIREFFNAAKAAHEKFLRSARVKDSARSGWRGVKLVSGSEQFSASESYRLKADGEAARVLSEARVATSTLVLATAKKLMSDAEKLATSNQVALFTAWHKYVTAKAKATKVAFDAVAGWPEWLTGKEARASATEAMAMAPRFAMAEFKRLAKATLPESQDESE